MLFFSVFMCSCSSVDTNTEKNNIIRVGFTLNSCASVNLEFDHGPVYVKDCLVKYNGQNEPSSSFAPDIVWVDREYGVGEFNSSRDSSVVLRHLTYLGEDKPLEWRETRRFDLHEEDYGMNGFMLENNDKVIVFAR